ncbi:MAG: polysaccharide deacetylase family protein [Cytophagales bacterium]|nr:polysaccharide deacetylase family protein [Cytophagales bacterium]
MRILLLLLISLSGASPLEWLSVAGRKAEKPKICLTFDDGNPQDMPGYTWQEWNALLLQHLRAGKVNAIFFAHGKALDNPQGKQILRQWSQAGHFIANHTYSHQSYNQSDLSFDAYAKDFLKNDSFINQFSGYARFFRYPYLKEGNTAEKRDRFRELLKQHQYQNGHVTVDASDWYVNSRLLKRLKENSRADIEPFKQFYLQHLYERASYYDRLALQLTGRQINHTLLLHHNLTSALFVDDLIKMFKEKGWEVIDASEAYKDEIYQKAPQTLPAGESLIWALAKETGKYEHQLRYPAEDSEYEEKKMDQLGL